MKVAQEAINIALENGATPEEATIWLALNLAKTTIQLNPNSNQLDPANVADMANKSLDIKGNRKTSEAVEKVIRNAREKHIQVYTSMEDITTNATAIRNPTEETERDTTKTAKGNMPTELWNNGESNYDSDRKNESEIDS